MSFLLRYSLQTGKKKHPSALLPESIPYRCCHDAFHCQCGVRWAVHDGRNAVYFCSRHMEAFIRKNDIFGFRCTSLD